MKSLLFSTVLIGIASSALGQPRPSTQSMPCAQGRALVNAQGAVVLNTGPVTYERFVRGANFCLYGERPEPVWVPAADTPQCPIGLRCVPHQRPSQG